MPDVVHITAVYHFAPLEEAELNVLLERLRAFGEEHGLRGLTLLAPEGINGTICGTEKGIRAWKQMLIGRFGPITFKDAVADHPVFKRWSVKRKPEIVGLKRTDIRPEGKRGHLTPQEWDAMFNDPDVIVLDARNDYEYAVGRFRGAVQPAIRTFKEFDAYAASAPLPKDKKILMYCTGGIRCEKALIAMQEQGYDHVYQLEGGILAYLHECGSGAFEGECFVFDQRVAVDAALRPSNRYDVCPHCGLPGDRPINCERCGVACTLCAACIEHGSLRACSKRCARAPQSVNR